MPASTYSSTPSTFSGRIAPDLLTPVVEHARETSHLRRRSESVPGVRVLRDQAQRHLLAASADEDRYSPHRGRIQLRPALLDHGQRALEVAEAAPDGPELEAVLVVVATQPAGADAEDESTRRDVIDGARHVGQQVCISVGVARDQRSDLGALRGLRHGGKYRPALEVLAVRV